MPYQTTTMYARSVQRYYKKLYNDGYAKAHEDMKAEFHLTLIDAKREVDEAKREAL